MIRRYHSGSIGPIEASQGPSIRLVPYTDMVAPPVSVWVVPYTGMVAPFVGGQVISIW